MAKNTLHLPTRGLPEHAVPPVPENTARALTPAEDQARRTLMRIKIAEEQAKAELAAKAKQ